jgi:hypothetical protein
MTTYHALLLRITDKAEFRTTLVAKSFREADDVLSDRYPEWCVIELESEEVRKHRLAYIESMLRKGAKLDRLGLLVFPRD